MVKRKSDEGYESDREPAALGCSTPHCCPGRAPVLSNPEKPAWCDLCKRKWLYLISSVTPSTARSIVALSFSPRAFEAPGSFIDGFCFFKPSNNPGFAVSLDAADEAILHGIACCRDKGSSPEQVQFLEESFEKLAERLSDGGMLEVRHQILDKHWDECREITGHEEWLFFLNKIAIFLLGKEKEEHTEVEKLRREVQCLGH